MSEPTAADMEKARKCIQSSREARPGNYLHERIAQALADARDAGYQEAVATYDHWCDGCTLDECITCTRWDNATDAMADSRFPKLPEAP